MKYQNYYQKPKNFPLGYCVCYADIPIEKTWKTHDFWIPTIHNVDWGFKVDTTESDKTNNVKFSIYQKNVSPNPFHSIELDVGLIVENLENDENSIHAEGLYEFTGDKNEMVIEIPGFDKITDHQNHFFNNKKEEKTFEMSIILVVKSTRLCDAVQMLDFYKFDPTIFDVEVNVFGNTMFLSKKLISLQSPTLAALVETQNIAKSDLPDKISFDKFHDFLQLIHGVDLQLNEFNIRPFLELAKHLKMPRVTEYCKEQMVIGCNGMSTNQIIELAEKWSFWDIVPRKLHNACSLKDLKAQNWDLEKLENEDVIIQILRRMYELC